MGITSELRAFIDAMDRTRPYEAERLCKVADRIDEEHARVLRETGEEIGADVRREWMPLPVDADGAPVRIGDVMEWVDGETFEVVGIGDGVLYYVEDGGALANWTLAESKIHHRVPTVEDVLREFADEVYADADNEIRDRDFLCAKYAKRLTLAEGEDA